MERRDGSKGRRWDPGPVTWALGLSVLLGVVESVKGWALGRNAPNDFGWTEALLANLPWWLLWGVLATAVFALVRRFPLERATWGRSLMVHVGASMGFSTVHLGISALIVWGAVSHTFLTFQQQSQRLLVGFFLTDVVTYWAIAAAFSARVARLRLEQSRRQQHALELRNARLESEKSQARLEALRRELSPHFLFNTLNSVSALAQRGEGSRAAVALARLSDLLRRVLDDSLEEQIPVDEEMELLVLYLDILKLRYGDRLEVQIQVEPGVRQALVPSLILQPLVENAVKHGVERVPGNGLLGIRVWAHDGHLELCVRNTNEERAEFRTWGVNKPAGESMGVGLRNTRGRLRALFGDAAELRLCSLPCGGAESRIRLPLTSESDVRLEA